MENTITIYRLNTSKKKLNKTGLIVTILNNIPFKFKNNYDLFNPVILFEYLSMSNSVRQMNEANYVKLRIFDGNEYEMIKYYFIVKKTFITKELVQLELHEDTLYTFMNAIMNMNLFVERSTNLGDSTIEDPYTTFKGTHTYVDSYSTSSIQISVGYNYFDYASTYYLFNTISNTFLNMYTDKNIYNNNISVFDNQTYLVDNEATVKKVVEKIRSDASFTSAFRSFYKLPISDALLDSIKFLDQNDTIFYSMKKTSASSLSNLMFDTEYTANYWVVDSKASEQDTYHLYRINKNIVCFDVCRFNFTLYDKSYTMLNHTKVYIHLPLLADRQIEPELWEGSIKIYLYVNLPTGQTTYLVHNTTTNKILIAEDVTDIIKLDLSTSNALENADKLRDQAYSLLFNGIGTAITGAMNPTHFGAAAVGYGVNLANALQSQKSIHPYTNIKSTNSFHAYLNENTIKAYQLKEDYIEVDANEFGKPCNQMATVNTLSGYAKFGGTFNNVIITGSDEERDDLISLLQDGIII